MRYLIVILLFSGLVYSQCNKDNWEDYYNSDGRDMSGCNLTGADLRRVDLSEANLTNANLSGVSSGGIRGKPAFLPEGWSLKDGVLIKK